jgi:hypothetical protein
MEQWELAERRYRQIVPRPAVTWDQVRRPELSAWLRRDVCPAIEQHAGRQRFRELASWAVRALAPQSESHELRLVSEIDTELAQYARALLEFSKGKLIARRIREMHPPKLIPAVTTVLIGGGSRVEKVRRRKKYDEVAALRIKPPNSQGESAHPSLTCSTISGRSPNGSATGDAASSAGM